MTKTNEEQQNSAAQTAKFKFEFMMMMIMAGRNEMAQRAADEGFKALDMLIEAGH